MPRPRCWQPALVCAHTHHSHTCRTRPCTPTTQVELNWYNNTYANPEDGTDFYGIDIIGDELHLKSGEFKLTPTLTHDPTLTLP